MWIITTFGFLVILVSFHSSWQIIRYRTSFMSPTFHSRISSISQSAIVHGQLYWKDIILGAMQCFGPYFVFISFLLLFFGSWVQLVYSLWDRDHLVWKLLFFSTVSARFVEIGVCAQLYMLEGNYEVVVQC